MKCPTCSHQLTTVQAGNITLDICKDACGGVWFDKSELEQFDEGHEIIPNDVRRALKNSSVVIDRAAERPCPKCTGTALTRTFFDAEKSIELDNCPKCEGVWLDLGEIETVRGANETSAEIQNSLNAYMTKIKSQMKNGKLPKAVEAVFRLIF